MIGVFGADSGGFGLVIGSAAVSRRGGQLRQAQQAPGVRQQVLATVGTGLFKTGGGRVEQLIGDATRQAGQQLRRVVRAGVESAAADLEARRGSGHEFLGWLDLPDAITADVTEFVGVAIANTDQAIESLREVGSDGVVERIDELAEAVAPTGTPDSDIESTASENPFLGEVETLDPGGRNGSGYAEQSFARPLAAASDDVINGTAGNDVLVGDEMPETSAALNQPISFFSLANAVNGTFTDATGV